MNTDQLISIARVFCWIAIAVAGALFIGATVLFIGISVNPEAFAGVHFDGAFLAGGMLNWQSVNSFAINGQDEGDPFVLGKINSFSLFILYMQCALICLFALLIFRKVLRMIGQGRFVMGNHAASFRSIGRYLLGIALLSSFIWIGVERGEVSRISIDLWAWLLVLGAYVLARSARKAAGSAVPDRGPTPQVNP